MSATSARQLAEEGYIRARMFGGGGSAMQCHADARRARAMTVLVTRATGFIEEALTRALLARGEEVRVLARARARVARLRLDLAEVVKGAYKVTKVKRGGGDFFTDRRAHDMISTEQRPGVQTNVGVRWRFERTEA